MILQIVSIFKNFILPKISNIFVFSNFYLLKMPIITFTSDYGTVDHRVSAIKGNILQFDARIIDITHEIGAYNLIQTAYILEMHMHFPKESIHINFLWIVFFQRPKNILVKDGWAFFSADNGFDEPYFFDVKTRSHL